MCMGMGESKKKVTVFEVLFDGPEDGPSGPAGDGTFTQRFGPKDKARAEAFAAPRTYYGRPTKAVESQVSRALARRWGLA